MMGQKKLFIIGFFDLFKESEQDFLLVLGVL